MARYAVKLGEIHLRSDTPITADERREAIKLMEEAALDFLLNVCESLQITFDPAP